MQTTSSYYLAVDGGGTKTTVWLANALDQVVGKGSSGPMSLAATTQASAVTNLLEAVREATKDQRNIHLQKVVIGLAGVDTPSEHQRAESLFAEALHSEFSIQEFVLVNDVVIALESGATQENAVALISGTGSNCFGRNAQGDHAKTGGMDFLLSDQGSGFDIGQQVLRAAVKSYDGRGTKTLLESLVCEHFDIASISDLKDKVYHPPLNKTEIAGLAKLCFIALEKKDTRANEIVTAAINELVVMVETVLKRLNMHNEPTDLVLVGGIATDPYVRQLLSLRFKVRYPKLSLTVPEHPSVYGALKLAIQHK